MYDDPSTCFSRYEGFSCTFSSISLICVLLYCYASIRRAWWILKPVNGLNVKIKSLRFLLYSGDRRSNAVTRPLLLDHRITCPQLLLPVLWLWAVRFQICRSLGPIYLQPFPVKGLNSSIKLKRFLC